VQHQHYDMNCNLSIFDRFKTVLVVSLLLRNRISDPVSNTDEH